MRSILLASLLVTAAFVAPAVAQATPTIVISELLPAPAAGDREFIELRNDGNASVDLAGWSIADDAGNTYTFGAWDLAPGQHVVVWGGGNATGAGPAWSKSSVWNNGGDEATLRDATGTVAVQIAYGSHANAVVAAPPTGQSIALDDWSPGTPSPGLTPEVIEGDAIASVQSVAPVIAVLDAPASVHRGEAFELLFNVHDDNGDLVAWNVTGPGELAAGTEAGPQSIGLTAPAQAGNWRVTISALDADGGTSAAAVDIDVLASGLEVEVDGPIQFELVPGAVNVSADTTFTIRNAGVEPIAPYFDISDFTGPGGAIVVADNLRLELVGDETQNVLYDGPLTQLPSLPGGQEWQVRLSILTAPTPLASGDYGTTFTVTE